MFAINKDFFHEIGTYDDRMTRWGGENIDLAFRVNNFILYTKVHELIIIPLNTKYRIVFNCAPSLIVPTPPHPSFNQEICHMLKLIFF